MPIQGVSDGASGASGGDPQQWRVTMFAVVAATAWARTPRPIVPSSVPTVLTYNLTGDFCGQIRSKFIEDVALSWHALGCDDVTMMVRRGFDAWAHNSLVSFLQTDGPADIALGTSGGRRDSILGRTMVGPHATTLEISDDFCWYTDRAFCDSVRDSYGWLLVIMGVAWSTALVTILHVCRYPATSAFDATARIVAWTVLISQPLALVTMYPCLVCYDFLTVVMHEVGHGLGLQHSDDTGALSTCGCHNESRACDPPDTSVMHSVFRHRSSACLSRDDVDGVRTLWGGDCLEPVWCYTTNSMSGFYRIHTSLVYSFAIAWALVFVRNRCSRCKQCAWWCQCRRCTFGPMTTDAENEPSSPGDTTDSEGTGRPRRTRRRVVVTSTGAALVVQTA